MSVISIIKSTNNYIADRVFAGVYGTRQESPADEEGQPPKSIFTIAPEFRAIGHLFTYLDEGTSPVAPGEFVDIEVPDEQAASVRNQLLYALKNRWKGMYKSMLGQRSSDMLTTMLNAESRNVDSAIDARFATFGLRVWSVPVTGTMRTNEDGYLFANEAQLMQALGGSPRNLAVANDEEVVTAAAREETAALAPIGEAAMTMGAVDQEVSQTPQWQGYAGIEADIKGFMSVVAESPEAAKAAAQSMIEVASRNPELLGLQVEPREIVATRQIEHADHVTEVLDDDDTGGDSDDDQDSLRDHYTF